MSRASKGCQFAVCVALSACTPELIVPVEYPILPVASPPCISVVERIQHLDQPSALGFSAVELLARVAGESEAPLVWLPPEPSSEYTLAYGPESGLSNVMIRVLPAAGDVRYRHELVSDTAPEDTECADGVLDVPVTVAIRSGTQALDETFPARLEATSVYRAQLSHSFPPGSWSGGFRVTDLSSLDPERTFSAGPLSLQVVLWEGGSQGSLSTEIHGSYTAKASAAASEAWPAQLSEGDSANLALWPSAAPCPAPSSNSLPSDAKVLGFSVSDVLAALSDQSARELTWSDGGHSALQLDFITPASELCQDVSDSLSFETSVHVHTLDGRVDVELPVQINASNADGRIAEISIQTGESLPARALQVLAPAGRGGRLRAGGYEALRVDLDATFREGLSIGTLTLSSTDPATPAAGEASNAPVREVASGRWSR